MVEQVEKTGSVAMPVGRTPPAMVGAHPSAGTARERKTPESSYSNSLFAGAGTSDTPAWSDSTHGRMAIRFFSRGVVGAAFFVAGSRMANLQLRGYHPDHWDRGKPLQWIAKGFDVSLGKGIQKTVETFAGLKHGFGSQIAKDAGKRAMTFRESRTFKYKINGVEHTMQGRSYGADIVGFTFDFAMMSVGDALARNIIQAFDPNVKQTWKVNDQGELAKKGERWHFVPGEFAKWAGKTTWRIFSKNQMEDWAAAIPYAFQMKFQRQFLSNVLNKRWNGHQLVFDHSWNGGAYRINSQGQIVGDYQLVGALDLHARFTGYNWYTLMFREGYDAIGRAWNRWKENDYKIDLHLPEHFNPITSPIDGALHAARYVTKSFIKANLYMNPACLFFWTFRVPQSKWRGRQFVEGELPRFGSDTGMWATNFNPFDPKHYEHFPTTTVLDKSEKLVSRALNPIGYSSFWLGRKLADASEKLYNAGYTPKFQWVRNVLQGDQRTLLAGGRRFAHEYVDAFGSYLPYTIAKTEFGLRVDDNKGDGKLGQIDVSLYKFMDDVASFKFKEIPEDLKRIWKLSINFEREIKVREGGDPTAQQMVKGPASTVHASTVRPEPIALARAPEAAANDARYRSDSSANDTHYDTPAQADQHWARRVAGSDIHPAQIHRSSPTIH